MNVGKEKGFILGVMLILLCGVVDEGFSRTWYVKPKVFEPTDAASEAASWSTAIRLWEALERAVEGDEILLQVGNYVETSQHTIDNSSYLITKNITLKGGYAGTDDDRLSATQITTLYPPCGGRVMIIRAGNVTLQNLSIRGGDASNNTDYQGKGGGLLVYDETAVTLIDVHFIDNRNSLPNGQGGAIACLGGKGESHSLISFKGRTTFTGNIAAMGIGGAGQGGAIYAVGLSELHFEGIVHFIDNTASMQDIGQGGAIYSDILLFSVEADTFIVERNYASRGSDGLGGGLYFKGRYVSIIQAKYVLMADNIATSSSSGHGKGGACFIEGWLLLYDGEIRGNAAVSVTRGNEKTAHGGAFFVKTGGKLDILAANITNNTLAPQPDIRTAGGAIYREDFSFLSIGKAVHIYDNDLPQIVPDAVWTVTLPQLHPTVYCDIAPGNYAVLRGTSFSFHPKTKRGFNLSALACTGGTTLFSDANGVFTFLPAQDVTLSIIPPVSITVFDIRQHTASAVQADTEVLLYTMVSPANASFQVPTWFILPNGSASFVDNHSFASQRTVRAGTAGSVANIHAYIEEFPEASVSYYLTSATEYVRKLTIFDVNDQHVGIINSTTEFDLYAELDPPDALIPLLEWSISPVDAAEFVAPLENLHRKVHILRTDRVPIKITAKTVDGSSLSATFTVNDTHIPVTNLQLLNDQGHGSSTINGNDVLQLTAVINPSLATHKELHWSIISSGSGHAYFIPSPNPSGEIRWIAPNLTNVHFQVKVEATDGSGRFATHNIFVNPIPLSQLSLVNATGVKETTINYLQTVTLYPHLFPSETSDRTLTWNITPAGAAEFDDIYGANLSVPIPRPVKALCSNNSAKVSITNGTFTDTFTLWVLPLPLDSIVVNNQMNVRQTLAAKGEEVILRAEFFPDVATDKSIEWDVYPVGAAEITKSSALPVCTVQVLRSNVDISITAFALDGSVISGKHLIRVKPKVVTKVILEDFFRQKAATIPYQGTIKLEASYFPEDADADPFQWEIIPPDAAEFTDNNLTAAVRTVKTIKPGATITISVNVGERQAIYQLTSGDFIPVNQLSMESELLDDSCYRDDIFSLTTVLSPDNATNKSVEWEISPKEAAEFLSVNDANAHTRSLQVKQAHTSFTVTAYADERQQTASRTFHVRPLLVTALNILGAPTPPNILYVDEDIPLTAKFLPADATNPALHWTVLPTGAAELISGSSQTERTLRILQPDKGITVTVTAGDGSNKTSHCILTANPIALTELLLIDANGRTASTVESGSVVRLATTFSPANATNKELVWSLSNNNASFINDNPTDPTVRFLSATTPFSQVTVTVAAKSNPLLNASYNLTIRPNFITAMRLLNEKGEDETSLERNDEVTLTAHIIPLEGSLHALDWTILPAGVFEFTDEGTQASSRTLRALKPGTSAIVTAITKDGSFLSASHTLYVEPLVLRSIVLQDPQGNNTSDVDVDQSLVLSLIHNPQEVELPPLQWSISPADAATLTESATGNPLQRVLTSTHSNQIVTVTVTAPYNPVPDAVYTLKVRLIPITGLALASVGNLNSIRVGENLTLQATVTPSWASIRTLNWSISPETAAMFTESSPNGLTRILTALEARRTVYVTITATDGTPTSTTFEFAIIPSLSLLPLTDTNAADVRYSNDGHFHLLNLTGAHCRLFDVSGRMLDTFIPSSPDEKYLLSHPLSPGIYILYTLRPDGISQTFRFLK
ncbi:MAG: hypothetical protein LBU03_01205 [Tannerellaceae bacterium]|jgi:hypothetical protein|nr:hypothetical protein [Tannerellaceae bacterium]